MQVTQIKNNSKSRDLINSRQAFEKFLTPPRKSSPEVEQKLLEQATIFSIPANSVNLNAYCWGEGATVLLVHGWGGRGTQLGYFVKPLVESGYRVLAFDAPAHGRTPGNQTSGFELAVAIETVAKNEGSIHGIIAHSLGATSTTLALSKSVVASKVVFLGALCWLSSAITGFSRLARLSKETEEELRNLMENKFGEDVWQRSSVDRIAAKFNIPALLFHDRSDREVSYQESMAIARSWPNAQLIVTSGLGHKRILRDDRVVRQTVNFITEGVK